MLTSPRPAGAVTWWRQGGAPRSVFLTGRREPILPPVLLPKLPSGLVGCSPGSVFLTHAGERQTPGLV